MSIGSFFPLGVGYTPGLAPEVRPVAVVVIDANVTWTVAQIFSGYLRRTLTATARTDTTPPAAAIVAALPQDIKLLNASWYLEVTRTDAAGVALTVAGGTGVTLTGTATIAATTNRTFLFIVTNVTPGAEAITMNSIGASAL